MAEEKKKFSLGGIDNAAEEKGSFMKTLWQLVKFLVVSGLVTIIQLALAALLPLVCDQIHTLLPEFLRGIFTPTMFTTGSKEATKYVIDGVVTWGYVLPFLLSTSLLTSTASIRIKRQHLNLMHHGTTLLSTLYYFLHSSFSQHGCRAQS